MENNFFLNIRFGLGVYIVEARNEIFPIVSAFAINKKVIISDISGQTLDQTIRPLGPKYTVLFFSINYFFSFSVYVF